MLAGQMSQSRSHGVPAATGADRTPPEPILLAGAVKLKGPQNGLGGWGLGLTEVSEQRAATFPHPTAAAQQAVGPQPINDLLIVRNHF